MISQLINDELIALFTNVAKTHSSIAHLSTAEIIRFNGFNGEELNANNRSVLNWDKLVLSLGLPAQPGLAWNYADTGTSTQKRKTFEVAVLGIKGDTGNFENDEQVSALAEEVCDDIQQWIYKTVNTPEEAALWPVVDLIDLDFTPARRLYNVGVAGCSGAAVRFNFNSNLHIRNSNPLLNMTP